jgi:DNA-binding transcriptional MerR regulator
MDNKTFTLDELCTLIDYSKRTVRYYMQLGLVPRPIGEARAAYYTGDHLGRLLWIKQLSVAGVSLERIREIVTGEEPPVPFRVRRPGSVAVRSHLYVAPGIEVQIDPDEADLTPEDIRELVKEIMACAEKLFNKKTEKTGQDQ